MNQFGFAQIGEFGSTNGRNQPNIDSMPQSLQTSKTLIPKQDSIDSIHSSYKQNLPITAVEYDYRMSKRRDREKNAKDYEYAR